MLLARLGIADQVEAKLLDAGSGDPLELVVLGQAELAVSTPDKVESADGIEVFGPLPSAIASMRGACSAL